MVGGPDHLRRFRVDNIFTYSSWLQISAIDNGMDNYLGYTYKSQVNNAEINERIRLNELNPFRNWSWLWGFRYFRLSDNLTLNGSDLDYGDQESFNVKTENNLVGMQAGLQWAWGWDRLQFSTEGKVGLYANIYKQHDVDTGSGPAGIIPHGHLARRDRSGRASSSFRSWPDSESTRCSGCDSVTSVTVRPGWHWRRDNTGSGTATALSPWTGCRWAWKRAGKPSPFLSPPAQARACLTADGARTGRHGTLELRRRRRSFLSGFALRLAREIR